MGRAEYVDQINAVDSSEIGKGFPAENLIYIRVDRDDFVTGFNQALGHVVRRPAGIGRKADNGDAASLFQDVADCCVVVDYLARLSVFGSVVFRDSPACSLECVSN